MHATPSSAVSERDELGHVRLQAVERRHREDQREHEQADAVADDVVAQQRRRDDPRRQLAAGHLDRDQQRAEREHEERQRERDDRLVERLRAGRRRARRAPSEPRVEARSNGVIASTSAIATIGTVHSADLR